MAALNLRPLHRVLVAVDLSLASDRVVHRAMLLPLALEAKVEIVHALPTGMPAEAHATAQRNAEEKLIRLKGAAESAPGYAASIAIRTVTGLPYVEIIRRSREIGADLVVVGREGRKKLRDRLVMGSTPKRVIRKGDVPVLVVALEPTEPYRRIVLAVDLTDAARPIVNLAWRIVGPNGAQRRAYIVHAYHVPFEGWIRESGLGQDFKVTAASQLQKLHNALGDQARRWRTVLRKGDPRVVVLAEAERRRADLIVLGTHGRSGVSHALLGSVAEWITSEARCDIAITRPMRYSFELP